ncbi:hypothetical protein ONE63_005512 [Megalurothrips usitatus]|uniref:Protein lingerer n=1 Tax=Megalurothrips usitatus TaxID=439358 RepID=A0AAV7Y1X8_9NEOP|nr:hypothetical protein ONE63_005512 [Megalurothrips usitatus]
MSSANRATSRGSKGGKGEHVAATAKAQKLDTKTETAKSTDNPKAQEQMRIAQIIDGRYEDPQIKEKIKQIMDATHKSEIEVCTALHDCDNDANRAVNMLIEGQISTDWETSSKKKKSRQPSANAKPDAGAPRGISSDVVESENWDDDTPTKPSIPVDAQRARTQRGGGGAPRMRGRGAQDNRGWRGRENKENERNLEESRGAVAAGGDRDQRDGFRRGGGGNRGGRMSNGAGRGGGRGGSRTGPRSFSGRGGHDRGAPFPRTTSWNPDEDGADAKSSNFPSPEDWDNEEYTGSLSDTKVFTPSNVGADGNDAIGSHPVNSGGPDPALTTSPGVNSTNLNYAQSAAGGGSLSAAQTQYLRQLPDNKLASSNALSGPMGGLNSMSGPLPNSADSKTAARMTYNSYAASAAHSAASSAPAAASYPSTYSSVSASVPSVSPASEANFPPASGGSNFSTYQSGQAQPASYTATATSYSTVYGSHQDGSTQATGAQPLPARTKTQRPRVPPPSKIPQSAVEMPGDGVNNIGLLDVQFGALDFGPDAFDTNSSEPQPSPQSTPSSQSQSHPNPMTKYSAGTGGGMDSTPVASSQPSMDLDPFTTAGQKAAALTQTLKETLLQGSQSQQTQASSQSQNNDLKSQPTNFTQQSRGPGVGVVVPSALDSLVKSDQSSVGSAANASAGGSGAAGSLSYSAPSSNYQSSYNTQKSVGSGYQSATGYNPASYSSSQASSGVSASSSNAYSTSYPSNASSQAYQQNVYGGSGGSSSATGGSNSGSTVGSSSGYTTSSNAGVYQNSYGTTTASASSTNKLTSVLNAAKDLPQYDTTATSSSNLSGPITSSTSGAPGLSVPNVSGSVNNSPSLGLPGATSLPSANNTSSTKVTNSSAKSVVQNMPPGVPPIIPAGTQYIMSQGGLQYFQQPAVYSYEEQQILPLRIPHMPAGYYDISFQQAPTSLATGREGSLANVPYSMSDARFARTDNASPVPSSLSQQNATQAHQQPMMNAAGFPPGYAYAYYGGSVLPANYQYGTPTALYPQVAPATNAHGNSNSTQYPKPGNYGSSYGSGYEGLSASQDYSKGGGGYAGGHSGAQTASKAGVGANAPSTGSSATDIYNKTVLSKVNSYDKGFHSGTPPPFNLAGNQNTGMAPSGAFPTPLYIPPPMHQPHHQSTTLMQHQVPVHQQMDMRNTSRRSESGNNSGQRSQSSTQSNKTGSKQVYSPNYWAN